MTDQPRCPNCHQPYHPIEVHGHVQCSVCRVNIDPCCGGASRCHFPLLSAEGASLDDLNHIADAEDAGA
jgi:hypothetical protein